MRSRARRLALAIATLLALIPVARGQEHPLPDELMAHYVRFPAARLTLQAARWKWFRAESPGLGAALYIDSRRRTITVRWGYLVPGAKQARQDQVYETDSRPTALTARIGASHVFYVVGWDETEGSVVVEEWRFDEPPYALSLREVPDRRPRAELSPPGVHRRRLWTSPADGPLALRPIADAACFPTGNELWLLESTTPRRLHALPLDVPDPTPELLWTLDGEHALPHPPNMFTVGRHPEGGLLVWAQPRRPWHQPGVKIHPTYSVFFARDADRDGKIDETGTLSWRDFHERFPIPWEASD